MKHLANPTIIQLQWCLLTIVLLARPIMALEVHREMQVGNNDLNALAFDGRTHFVAVGNGGTILHSSNLIAWHSVGTNAMHTYKSVAFGKGNWVAVGLGGVIATSSNAVNWSLVRIWG